MTSGTLVMLHGMTGTSEKMQPLADRLVPNGWNVICPQAEIEHPNRGGFAWWLRAEDPTLPFLKSREVVWMHGRKDHVVPLEVAIEHAEIYESAGWQVTRLEHEKGHMVNLNQLDELKNSIQRMADSI